jgi:galactitol-specific phosphotransferase system IIB component
VLEALILPDGTGSVLKGYKLRTSSTGKLTLIRGDQNATEAKLENLISEEVIRVVEVRSHPLGLKDLGIVVVLEVTSSSAQAKVQRYLSLDAERVASAVIDIGELNYSIEVSDATVSQIITDNCISGIPNKIFHFVRNGIDHAFDGWKGDREDLSMQD